MEAGGPHQCHSDDSQTGEMNHQSMGFLFWSFCIVLPLVVKARTYHLVYPALKQPHEEATWGGVTLGIERYFRDHGHETALSPGEIDVEYVPYLGCHGPQVPPLSELLVGRALNRRLDAILGPVCSSTVRAVAIIVSRWDVPIFPLFSSGSGLTNKTEYPNVIRVSTPATRLSSGALGVMEHYGWHHIAIYASRWHACRAQSEYLESDFRERGYKVTDYILHEFSYARSMPAYRIDSDLNRIRQRTRVIWMCSNNYVTYDIMMRAQALGMTNGDFVFMFFSISREDGPWPAIWTTRADENTTAEELQLRKEAFYPLKVYSENTRTQAHTESFLHNASRIMLEQNLTYSWYNMDRMAARDAMYLHDTVYLYLTLLDEIIRLGGDSLNQVNGSLFFERAKGKHFEGETGEITMDDNADNVPVWGLWCVGPETEELTKYMELHPVGYDDVAPRALDVEPYWGTPNNEVPPDIPLCGLRDEFCPPDTTDRDIIIACSASGGFILLVLILVYLNVKRRQLLEAELQQMLWKIKYEDIDMFDRARASAASFHSAASCNTLGFGAVHSGENVGLYKGTVVYIRRIHSGPLLLDRDHLLEFKTIRDLKHENINDFIGACITPPNMCIVTVHCTKGSLEDIIQNDDITLDWMFKYSMIMDIANGMAYIHHSGLESHGHLRSSNCLVDSRWQVKIASIGLRFLKNLESNSDVSDNERHWKQMWTAPELLRISQALRPANGSKKGDVYSFSIILQELLFRALPFFISDLSPEDVIKRVSAISGNPYRPNIPTKSGGDSGIPQEIIELMTCCWSEDPFYRPDFEKIKRNLRQFSKGGKFNIVDNMIEILEKYANNLEDIVQSRTAELAEEKKKTEALLFKMLPRSVAEKLKLGGAVAPEMYDGVTIYFSDIVGFMDLSSESTPIEIVTLLNDLYSMFDGVIERHDVYKVETIGDSYMVASGLPERNGERHVGEIASLALELLSSCYTRFKVRHRPNMVVPLRIGMHSGPCAAGVVGLTMPRFCLFGDTVNMASRMETNGQALRIHMSCHAHQALGKLTGFHTQLRGEMAIKGKGMQKTYWLVTRDGFDRPLPGMHPA